MIVNKYSTPIITSNVQQIVTYLKTVFFISYKIQLNLDFWNSYQAYY